VTKQEYEWLKKRQNNVELRVSLMEGVLQSIKRALPKEDSATFTKIVERYDELIKEGEADSLYEPEPVPEPEPSPEPTPSRESST
tara:strand:+ start:176 stop:430 length:255 start_codon:yes stop_codon:yes gene_type:complete